MMFSSSGTYNPAKLRSSAMCTAGESFISQRINWATRYTFSAKEKDKNTGYHYFGARYYDSETSVWLSVDPMASGFPGISPYAYCYNNPMNFIDKWGLSPSSGGPGGQNPELEEKDGNGNQTQYYGNGKVLIYPNSSSSNSNTNESRGSSNNVNCDNEFASINNYSFLNGRDQSIGQPLTNRDLAIIFKDSYIDTKRHLETNGIGQQNLDKEDYGLWVLENIHLEPDEEHSYLGYAVINAIVFLFEGDDYASFGNRPDTKGEEKYPLFSYGPHVGMPKSLMYIYFKDGNKVHKARIQWVITMPLYAN